MKTSVEVKLNEIASCILKLLNEPQKEEKKYGLYTGDFGVLIFMRL